MLIHLLFALALTAAPAVEHYKLNFAIDPTNHTLTADAEIRVRNSSDRVMSTVPMLLYRLMDIESVSDAAGKPLKFTQKVVKFPDEMTWQVNAAEVTLATPLAPGETTAMHLKYGGPLLGYREVMQYVRDTIGEEYSLIRSETMAYPIIASPSVAGWRAFLQRSKFDYDIDVAAPQGSVIACSGDEIHETHCSGRDKSQIDVAIAKFRLLDDAERHLRVYAMASDAEAGATVMAEMRRALDFFRSYFGEMPGAGSLTLIEIPDGWGSYGLPGHIFQSAAAFKDNTRAGELYHEIGHIWNAKAHESVQRTRYFDEAFASYFEALAVRQLQGTDAYRALLQSYRDTFAQRAARDPRGRSTPIRDYGKEELGVFSYSKGAWSLYVLHQLLGEEPFRRAISDFLLAYSDKPASFEEFRRSVEQSSGRDLQAWFEQWISGTESSAMLLEGKSVEEMVAQGRGQ